MIAKTSILLLLAAATFVPAAVLASQQQVAHRAFSSEGTALQIARRLELPTESMRTQPVTVATVLVVGTRPAPRAQPASSMARLPDCGEWRALDAGPKARAAGVPQVRTCDAVR
jgi:hypothetical protein